MFLRLDPKVEAMLGRYAYSAGVVTTYLNQFITTENIEPVSQMPIGCRMAIRDLFEQILNWADQTSHNPLESKVAALMALYLLEKEPKQKETLSEKEFHEKFSKFKTCFEMLEKDPSSCPKETLQEMKTFFEKMSSEGSQVGYSHFMRESHKDFP